MKSIFRGYYRPSDEDFRALWNDCTFVFDANVLLNMYGYSIETRNQLIEMLDKIKDRIWIPHQFAQEYQRNRAKSISEQVSSYANAHKDLSTLMNERLQVRHRHPFIKNRSLSNLRNICSELEKGRKEYEGYFSSDPVFDAIADIFIGRVGPPIPADDFSSLCDKARSRYDKKIPPGYSDFKKPEPDAFGDYFGWHEILSNGKINDTSTILVTDDQKEDWWNIFNKDRRLGPRPELISEYWLFCNKPFYMYTLEEFMRYATTHLHQVISPSTIEEVRQRSAIQSRPSSREKPKTDHEEFYSNSINSYTTSSQPTGDSPKLSETPEKPEF